MVALFMPALAPHRRAVPRAATTPHVCPQSARCECGLVRASLDVVALFIPRKGYGPFEPGLNLLRCRLLSFRLVHQALEPELRVLPCGLLRRVGQRVWPAAWRAARRRRRRRPLAVSPPRWVVCRSLNANPQKDLAVGKPLFGQHDRAPALGVAATGERGRARPRWCRA